MLSIQYYTLVPSVDSICIENKVSFKANVALKYDRLLQKAVTYIFFKARKFQEALYPP